MTDHTKQDSAQLHKVVADKREALRSFRFGAAGRRVGARGRGTPELQDVSDRVDIMTGTLGKALGGASGGYTSGRREIIDLLRQRSRPYLFSNSVAPAVAGASLKVLDLLESGDDLRARLRDNTAWFRTAATISRPRQRPSLLSVPR